MGDFPQFPPDRFPDGKFKQSFCPACGGTGLLKRPINPNFPFDPGNLENFPCPFSRPDE